MIAPVAATNEKYGLGFGSFQVSLTVVGSTASTFSIGRKFARVKQAVASSAQYCQVNTTSSAVKSLPSDHLMPGLSFQVTVLRSLETSPFSTVGTSAARFSESLPFSSHEASGSTIRRAASASLVPVARCGLSVVTACQ